jgi:hypothetical protein
MAGSLNYTKFIHVIPWKGDEIYNKAFYKKNILINYATLSMDL